MNWLAFLSALGGGVITAASSLWLAVRRERREAERDAQDRARELRMGARLVYEQLLLASSIAKTSRATKCWWVDPWIEKFRGAWTSSASLLARDCESLVWLRVSYAVSIVEELVGYRALCEGRLVTDQHAELLPGMCEDIDAGIAALKPYICLPIAVARTAETPPARAAASATGRAARPKAGSGREQPTATRGSVL